MKKIILLLIPLAIFSSCDSKDEGSISVTEAFAKMEDEDVIILDVRTPEEYEEGHIEGARHINFYDDDFEQKLEELPEDKEYIVYCHSGSRSGRTYKQMKEMDFEQVYNLKGGIEQWQEEGKEVVE